MTADMRVERFGTTTAFRAAVEPFLAQQEGANCVMLAIAGRQDRSASTDAGSRPYFAAVTSGTRVLLAATRTAPFQLLLSSIPSTASPEVGEGTSGPYAESANGATEADALARSAVSPLVDDLLAQSADGGRVRPLPSGAA